MLGIVARDGAFATHLRLPIRNLHAVPDAMPDEVAAFTEPTAAALELQQQVRVSPGDRAVVVGAGKLGNLVAQTHPEGRELARRAVRLRGTIVLKSTYHGKAAIDMAPFVVDEITLVGSRCGPFAPALASLARGEVDPRPLVEARYPLAAAVAAFGHAARPGALKVLVEC